MMFTRKPIDAGNGLVERASQATGDTIHAVQAAATAAVDGLAEGAQALQQQAGSALNQATRQVEGIARHGAQVLHTSTQHLLDQAYDVSSRTQRYIEREPVKAVLIAAATGAALMGLVTVLARARRHP